MFHYKQNSLCFLQDFLFLHIKNSKLLELIKILYNSSASDSQAVALTASQLDETEAGRCKKKAYFANRAKHIEAIFRISESIMNLWKSVMRNIFSSYHTV